MFKINGTILWMNTIIIIYRIRNGYAVKGRKIRKGAKISLTAALYRYIHLYESVFYTERDKLFKNGIG